MTITPASDTCYIRALVAFLASLCVVEAKIKYEDLLLSKGLPTSSQMKPSKAPQCSVKYREEISSSRTGAYTYNTIRLCVLFSPLEKRKLP
jgi:hypothetical protein